MVFYLIFSVDTAKYIAEETKMLTKILKIILNILSFGLPLLIEWAKKKQTVNPHIEELADSVLEEARKKSVEQHTTKIIKK